MGTRRVAEPSAIRTGLIHFVISLGVFAGLSGAAAAAVHFTGDARDAGPSLQLAMFDDVNDHALAGLKSRFDRSEAAAMQLAALKVGPRETAEPAGNGPDLGVPDPRPNPGDTAASAAARTAPVRASLDRSADAARGGVRINGKTVLPGEAFSEVQAIGALPRAPISGLTERTRHGIVPRIGDDGSLPADAYARPFYVRGNPPTVSIIVGGLGINYTHTKSAIEELPPEVTLAFAPHARGLSTWIRRARDAGHEVILELPLEPYEHGRVSPHPWTLTASAGADANAARLERLLALSPGYFAVMNYQGDKFVKDSEAVTAMLDTLSQRGVAFIEDGSLPKSSLADAAEDRETRYARADVVIDARIDANAMQDQLSALEGAAREEGAALGTAIAYPLTIDTLKAWTEQLADKGIVLAPASALQSRPAPTRAQAESRAAVPLGAGSLP